jgi:type IV pilus assembly protein PilN
MIRSNLATRPFYNERAVRLWLLIAALLVAGATAFNASRVLRYSRSDTQLAMQASRDESRAADLRQQASRLRATVDPKQIEYASTEARQANDLIDRRTFSWTELLNRLETTLPADVHIVALRPKVDRKNGTVLAVSVLARTVDDVNTFMENLEATGAFRRTGSREEHIDDQGLLEATLETTYVPGSAKPEPAESKDPEKKDPAGTPR